MFYRLLTAFHVIMFLSSFVFFWAGGIGIIIAKEENDTKSLKWLYPWAGSVVLYWLGIFIYWLVVGNLPI